MKISSFLKIIFVLLPLIILSQTVYGEEKNSADWTGNDWLRYYAEEKSKDKIVAMMMALDVAYRFNKEAEVCPAKGSNGAQILAIVEKFMKTHPELWHYRAQPLIAAALREVFPCPSKE